MTKTLVTYDDYDTVYSIFIASFIPAESWNGAAMPYFDYAEASRIAEDCATSRASSTFYRWHGGTFQEDINADSPEEIWQDVRTMIDPVTGATLYEMGQGWTWCEIPAEDSAGIAETISKLSTDHFMQALAGNVHYPTA